MTAISLDVDADLLLEDGTASSFGGRNSFSGSKALHTRANRNPASNLSPLIVPLGNIGGPDSPDCFAP